MRYPVENYDDFEAFPMDLWDAEEERRNLMIGAGVGAAAGALYPLAALSYSRPQTALAGAVAGAVLALIWNATQQ
jgi:hypothetical protein